MWNGIGLSDAPPALAQGPGLYRVLVDSLDQCVFLLDPDGRHMAANAPFCRWLARPETDVLGRTAFEFWPPALAQRLAADDRRVLEGERLDRDEQLPRGPHTRSVRLIKVPVRDDPDGPIEGVLGMFRDVTEERAREEQLRQTGSEGVGRLAAGLAHDLEDLQTVFQVNIPLVREALPPASPQRELVAVLEKTARLVAELTGQLLAFARCQAVRLQPVNLNAVLGDVIGLLGRAIDPRVRLEVRRRPGLAPVLADPAQMAQVILHLCMNACEAMPAGGRLTLETDEVNLGAAQAASHPEGRPGSFVRLRVWDTGEGMAEAARARVFEPFFTPGRPGKGTGLGLAAVRDAARQADGWVECTSAVGAGSCFALYLPGPADCGGCRAGDGLSALRREEDVRTILLVEDDRTIRMLTRSVLEKHGYRVLLAESGGEAIETYRRKRGQIALVLLGRNTPTSVLERAEPQALAEALDELRAIDPDTRVLLASGRFPEGLPPEVQHCVRGFLPRPYRADNLLCAVKGILARGRAAFLLTDP